MEEKKKRRRKGQPLLYQVDDDAKSLEGPLDDYDKAAAARQVRAKNAATREARL